MEAFGCSSFILPQGTIFNAGSKENSRGLYVLLKLSNHRLVGYLKDRTPQQSLVLLISRVKL